MKLHRKLVGNPNSIVALVLALWWAGAGCVVVSYAHAAALNQADLRATRSVAQRANGIPSSMGTHSCCKARRSSAKRNAGAITTGRKLSSDNSSDFEHVGLPEAPAPSGARSCCPLTSGTFVAASRATSDDENASAPAQLDSLSPVVTISQRPRAHPLRLPDQAQTYLRGCVFLI